MAKKSNEDTSVLVPRDTVLAHLFRNLIDTIGQIADVYEGKELSNIDPSSLKRKAINGDETSDSKQKKPKAKKDKNEPKGPGSAYLLFCKDKRDEIKKKNPQLENKEMFKLLGEAWKKASEAEKKKYVKLYDKVLVEHKKDLVAYKASLNDPSSQPIPSSQESEVNPPQETSNDQDNESSKKKKKNKKKNKKPKQSEAQA